MKTLLLTLLSFFIFSNSIDCVAEYVIPGNEQKVIDKVSFWTIDGLKKYQNEHKDIKLDCEQKKKENEKGLALFFGIIATITFVWLLFVNGWLEHILAFFAIIFLGLWKLLKISYQYINIKFEKKIKFEEVFPEIIYYEKGDLIHYKNDRGMVKVGQYMGAYPNGTIAVYIKSINEQDIVDYRTIVKNENFTSKKFELLQKQFDGDFYNTKLKAMREINEEEQ